MANMEQQAPDHTDLVLPPVARPKRVGRAPENLAAGRAVQAHVEAILGAHPAQQFVVHRGGLQLPFGEQAADVRELARGQLPQAGQALVQPVVDLDVFTLQLFAGLPAREEGRMHDASIAARTFTDDQSIARRAARFVYACGEAAGQSDASRAASCNAARARSNASW